MTGPAVEGVSQFATFLLGDHYIGVGVSEVQEVLREQAITPVPLAPRAVAGLINLRGQIVPELDMRQILHLPPRQPGAPTYSVVVRAAKGAVSLLVDEIEDVLELDGSSLVKPPENLDPRVRGLLLGVHRMPERLLLLLDVGRTVEAIGD